MYFFSTSGKGKSLKRFQKLNFVGWILSKQGSARRQYPFYVFKCRDFHFGAELSRASEANAFLSPHSAFLRNADQIPFRGMQVDPRKNFTIFLQLRNQWLMLLWGKNPWCPQLWKPSLFHEYWGLSCAPWPTFRSTSLPNCVLHHRQVLLCSPARQRSTT